MDKAKETFHKAKTGLERDMNPKPTKTHIPSSDSDSGVSLYRPTAKLAGKKAVIIGGYSGIGRAVAILFAMEGAQVAISYLPEEEEDAPHTRAQVEKNGGEIHLIASDLTQPANCTSLVNRAVTALSGIDILVKWSATFRTNVDPLFHLTKSALAHLSNGAVIINSASVDAYIGTPSHVDYAASKGAVIAFTRALSTAGLVWSPLIATGMSERGQKGQGLGNWTPIERLGQPSEIATSEGVFMSGQTCM
ncbi:NAD(P)-binding protein [Daldinia sp. FL1419]|nr:NAD(P)-binding protein [Daldinia sp. FL1419]